MDNKYDNLTREQLLEKLHSISFYAYLTALTSEECLEVEIMTSKGTIYSWIGFRDWNVFRISCNAGKFEKIKEKVLSQSLTYEDIHETPLRGALEEDDTEHEPLENLSSMFASLQQVEIFDGNPFYGFRDDDGNLVFFSSEDELSKALDSYYSNVDTEWEDFDNDELKYWLDRYESEGNKIMYCFLEEEEDE